MHEDLVPPPTMEGCTEEEIDRWKTEFDVCATLREMGHDVRPLGVWDDLGAIRETLEVFEPHICFNLLEEFHGLAVYDQHVVSFLELLRQKYTGCNPRGLTLARDKALSKMILSYHRIKVPKFHVFPVNRKVKRPRKLGFPLIVKSLTEEGSVSISQASIVHDDEHLQERVAFVHRTVGTHAIAEQFIDGRELYVGVLGNARLETFPVWELTFKSLPDGSKPIASSSVKWDNAYRKRIGVDTGPAENLTDAQRKQIPRVCKRIYRALGLTGYARMDLRLTDDGTIYLLEANPNPEVAYGEDLAESAEVGGMSYEALLDRILRLGLRYKPVGVR